MITHDLLQGTPEWCQFRLAHDGASEAAAMLGLSKKVKRTELLRMKKTGIAREFTDWVQKNILDYGHEVEAMARPIVEELIGEDLYPVTCSEGRMSASCDGLTLGDDIAFEHKQFNRELAALVSSGIVPDDHMPQCQQIMLVTGAEKVMFVVSDGTRNNLAYCWVQPDQTWFERIRAGWKQFHVDLENYVPEETDVVLTATPTKDLPALSIQVDGAISLVSNLDKFGALLNAFIEGINQKPEDDQGFVDAENAIKVLQKAQDALEAAEASALAQTSSIDEMRRTVKLHADTARTTRLMLEKMVKVRKEQIRTDIVMEGKSQLADHISAFEKRIHPIRLPLINADFAGVIKGKKTIASLRDARDTELANAKIQANAFADKISANLETMRELASDYKFLFSDTSAIIMKDNADLILLVNARIAEHKSAEEKRLEAERERIREQERVRAEAAVKEEQERIVAEASRKAQEVEQQRIMAEAAAKAEQDKLTTEKAKIVAEFAPQSQAIPAVWPFPSKNELPAETPIEEVKAQPTMKIGELRGWLGLDDLEALLSSLGFSSAKIGPSKMYHESDKASIRAALIRHLEKLEA